MDFDAIYNEYRDKVECRLKEIIEIKEPKLIYEPFSYFMEEGGKRIRPVLTMFAAEAVSGKPIDALDSGCAIEILHNFTLVHDDIMDKSDMRRGKLTVHKKWDEPVAIITGDAMIGIAYSILPQHERYYEISQAFSRGLVEVCEGQVWDMQFNERKDVTLEEYLLMIDKKTAKLLETCTVVGGHYGLATPDEILALKNYANYLGLAFQIQDDMLDMIADEKKLGKKVGLDIQEGKKTFLIIKANSLAKEAGDKQLLDLYFVSNGLGGDYVEKFREMFSRLGVFEIAQNEVDRLFSEAKSSLSAIRDNRGKALLEGLVDKLNNRAF